MALKQVNCESFSVSFSCFCLFPKEMSQFDSIDREMEACSVSTRDLNHETVETYKRKTFVFTATKKLCW